MTRDAIVALFARRQEAWQRRNLDALMDTYAETATFESPMQGRLEGRDRVRRVYDTWLTAFPDIAFQSSELLIDGDRAVEFFTVSGTQAGNFAGVAPTGRRIQISGARLYTIDADRRITSERVVYDFTALMIQLGVLKTKAGN